jgi:hypothetical protein
VPKFCGFNLMAYNQSSTEESFENVLQANHRSLGSDCRRSVRLAPDWSRQRIDEGCRCGRRGKMKFSHRNIDHEWLGYFASMTPVAAIEGVVAIVAQRVPAGSPPIK